MSEYRVTWKTHRAPNLLKMLWRRYGMLLMSERPTIDAGLSRQKPGRSTPPLSDGVGTNGQVYPPLDGLYGLSWPLAPWDCSQWVALQTIDEEFNDSLEEVAGISILHTNVHCGLHIPSVHPKYRAIKTVLQQDV
ncbi:hypothetical protein H4Q26_006253 [Puccinia striiformis f. sp. tritici PST-130]|nr:hypothetical protein H4Q26_006253 [Puccinia striiformis f. sp. tritici PST-130]